MVFIGFYSIYLVSLQGLPFLQLYKIMYLQFCIALLTMLMMTAAESMLSKCSILRIIVALFFFLSSIFVPHL